jgi:DegV family protein with EDD domain
MGRIAVVTDSTADLTPAQAADAGVRVVPLYVRFGDEEFQAGVDLSTEAFWERLLAPGAPIPTTAAPSPGTFVETLEACFAEGAEAIVCPVIGSKISGTFGSATVASDSLPGREIHVIDTGSTSMSTGIPALLAAELAATGMAAAEVASTVRARLRDVDLYVAVDSLEYLRRGGRLSATRAALGTVLSVKPIITVCDGIVVMAESPRTRNKARERVVELVTAAPVDNQVANVEQISVRGGQVPVGAAQLGTDTGQQLAEIVWLGDIVICADFQPQYLVGLVAPDGEHDDWLAKTEPAQLAADVEPGEIG